MSYVLVSLSGDEATAANDEFARWFVGSYPPTRSFHSEHPSHDEVSEAVRQTPVAIVLGHDGDGSIRGASKGIPWVDPIQFGRIFSGARVWVYACDTCVDSLEQDLESFSREAIANGVKVFAGHASPIPAVPPFGTMPGIRKQGYEALARAFRAFVRGEDNAGELRRVGLRAAATGSGRELALLAHPVRDSFKSLRVRLRR